MSTRGWIRGTGNALFFSVLVGMLVGCAFPDDDPADGCYVLFASGRGDLVEIDAGYSGQDGPATSTDGIWHDTWQREDTWQKVIGEAEAQDQAASSDCQYLWVRVRGQGSLYAEVVYLDQHGYVLRDGTQVYSDGQGVSVLKVEQPPAGGSGGGSVWGWTNPKVICAELHRQGLMDDSIFEVDEAFGRYMRDNQRDVLLGYQLWAMPVVKWMQRSATVTRIVASVAKPWSYEMAYRMGARDKGSVTGMILMDVGVPMCRALGRVMIWAGKPGLPNIPCRYADR
jgi:hypothetical protein